MTQANGQLVRVDAVGGGSFNAMADNFPAYTAMPASQALGTFNFNTTGYSTYTPGGGTLQGWLVIDDANGGFASSTSYESKVINETSNTVMADTNVACRNGTYCFKNTIEYHAANLSNGKNKPRGTERPSNDAKMPHNADYWFGFSMYVPSDMCGDNSNQFNMYLNFSADSASQDFLHLQKTGNPARWQLEWGKNASSPGEAIQESLDLGPMDLGTWTDWVFFMHSNPTTGTLRVWKNAQGSAPVEQTQGQLPISGTGFGNMSAGVDNQWNIRQYAYTWHHQASACTKASQEILFDDVYIGSVANGTTFSDVHAARAAQP
jgi:hypothetical protein